MSSTSLGQSAIEYLMTYGWMLLVVAVIGGAIFAAVGDQSVDSTSGFSGGDVVVEQFGVSEDGELGLNVRSASGSGVVVSRVNVSDPDTDQFVYKKFTGDNRIGVGSSKIFELPNVSRSDSGNELGVEIVYDSGGLSNLSVRGTVSGSLELTDSGSYEGFPEDDHQPISDDSGSGGGGSLSLMQTVNYTWDGSGDVQVNETTAGSDGYQVDLNNDFSREVEEIRIVEMHGADGGSGYTDSGSGGLIRNATVDVSSYQNLNLWVGQTPTLNVRGWGRSKGGRGSTNEGGAGGGSTEIWTNSSNTFVAAADAGGGGLSVFSGTEREGGGGGGARGGIGFNDGRGEGFGGDAAEDGGQELGIASLEPSGQTVTGGSDSGSGKIIIEYYG